MRYSLALLCCLPGIVAAQGFPWELSPRLPVAAPRVFLGAGAQLAYTPSVATLEAVEGEWTCALYRQGTGMGTSAGGYIEWWYAAPAAVRLVLSAEYARVQLTAPSEPLPLADGRFLQTEYQLRYALGIVRGELLWRHRLWGWLWVGASGWLGFQWRGQEEQWEVVLSPSDYQFRTFPPSRQRRLSPARPIAVRPYGLGVRLRLGYDLMLARRLPVYASPALVLGTSLVSLAQTAAWQRWELGLEVPLLWGLPRH